MSDDIVKLKKNVNRTFLLFLLVNAVAIAISATGSAKTLYLFATIGGISAIVSILSLLRLSGTTDNNRIGRFAMQGLWIDCSMALGYLVTAPSSYFASTAIVWGVGLIAGVLVIILSIYLLLRVRKVTGVPLSI
jgi:hypothetical protein